MEGRKSGRRRRRERGRVRGRQGTGVGGGGLCWPMPECFILALFKESLGSVQE